MVATLDGDGQNDPADIPRLWRLARENGSDVAGLIAGHRTNRRDAWSTRLGSWLANGVRGRVLGDRSPDTGCGLKLFPRRAFLGLPRFDHMHRFLPALFGMAGRPVMMVPVNHRPRTAGRSHYDLLARLGVGLADLMGVIWLRARWLDDGAGTEGPDHEC